MSESTNKTLSIAVMSGKGGVGKSNIALNLGFALAQDDYPTLLFDCDLGLANLDVLLGIAPKYNIQDIVAGTIDAKSAVVPLTEESGDKFSLLPSSSGIAELADMSKSEIDSLLKTIQPAFDDYKLLLLDLGAGINDSVQFFAAMATVRLIILTPEPTSLTDAYALIKVLKTNANITDFLVLVNQVENKAEADDIFNRLSVACDRFIGVKPVYLGLIRSDSKVPDAVRRQKPLLKLYPESKAASDIKENARRLTKIYSAMLPKIGSSAPLNVK